MSGLTLSVSSNLCPIASSFMSVYGLLQDQNNVNRGLFVIPLVLPGQDKCLILNVLIFRCLWLEMDKENSLSASHLFSADINMSEKALS